MAISRNAILPQLQSPKSLLLLHFLPNRLKIWRYGVKLNFSLNLCFRFLKKFSKKFYWPFSKKSALFFGLKMANIAPFGLKIGLPISLGLNDGQNKNKVHIFKFVVKNPNNWSKIGQVPHGRKGFKWP